MEHEDSRFLFIHSIFFCKSLDHFHIPRNVWGSSRWTHELTTWFHETLNTNLRIFSPIILSWKRKHRLRTSCSLSGKLMSYSVIRQQNSFLRQFLFWKLLKVSIRWSLLGPKSFFFHSVFSIWINQNQYYVILGGKIRRFVIGKSWEHVVSPSINDTKLLSEPVTGGQKIRNFFNNCGVVLTSPSFTLLMLLLW